MQYLLGLPRYLTIMAAIAVIGGVFIALIAQWVFKAENLEDEDSVDDASHTNP